MKKFLILIFAATLIWSCSEDSSTDSGNNDNQRVIKIGALLALSGDASSFGQSSEAGVDIAAQDLLDHFLKTGINMGVQVIKADTKSDPAIALDELKELKSKGVKIVIGPSTSAAAEACLDYANRNDILLVSPSSVAISLANPNDNLFRMAPNDKNQAKAISAIMDNRVIDAVAVVVRDDVWGRDLYNAVSSYYEQVGVIAEPYFYDPQNYDAQTIVDDLAEKVTNLSENYNLWNIGAYMITFEEGNEIMELAALNDTLTAVNWFGSSAYAGNKGIFQNKSAAELASKNILICPAFGMDPAFEAEWQPVYDAIEQQIARKPEVYGVTAYEGLYLAGLAHYSAGADASFQLLKDAFRFQTTKYRGVAGSIELDDNGDRVTGVYYYWSVFPLGSDFEWDIRAIYRLSTDGISYLR